MEDWQRQFGEVVRATRLRRGLTQEKLAGDALIDLTYLGGIERGHRNPSLAVIVRIAAALGVSPANLLTEL
jgi:transcriptional regulator with XRE-family HTH domain